MEQKKTKIQNNPDNIIDGEIISEEILENTSLVVGTPPQIASISLDLSEDIKILDDRKKKYFGLQKKIKKVLESDSGLKDAVIEDIVSASLQVGDSPTWFKVLTLGITLIPQHYKRKKLKKVIKNILEKVFDPSLSYSVDYKDLKMTCDYIGGEGYFDSKDHKAIYMAIIQKLKAGPLRELCIKNDILDYVTEKLAEIDSNYVDFRMNEL